MRPRNKKNLEKRMESCKEILVENPCELKGRWAEGYKSLRVEVGCGKGGFILGMAEKNPDVLFVGIEVVRNVICTAAEKITESGLANVRLINKDARYMFEYFEDGEIEKIYLNFSDPWPRTKEEKNRLTSDTFLPLYTKVLVERGEIVQKTDNRPLFDFSVESYNNFGAEIKKLSYDLHSEAWYGELGNVVTEYEHRFAEKGVPICYADVILPPKASVEQKINDSIKAILYQRECEEKGLARLRQKKEEQK